jgi:hypothetical protein
MGRFQRSWPGIGRLKRIKQLAEGQTAHLTPERNGGDLFPLASNLGPQHIERRDRPALRQAEWIERRFAMSTHPECLDQPQRQIGCCSRPASRGALAKEFEM